MRDAGIAIAKGGTDQPWQRHGGAAQRPRAALQVPVLFLAVALVLLAAFGLASADDSGLEAAGSDGAAAPNGRAGADAGTDVDALLDALGAKGFAEREEATRAIARMGPSIGPRLERRLETATDPEVIYRLRFILENITPPERAVLVLRSHGGPLLAGEVITHANGQRIRQLGDLRPLATRHDVIVRVTGAGGPRDVGPLRLDDERVRLVNFRSPRGEQLAAAVRLYAEGFVERAYERIAEVGEPPEDEFDRLLLAMIAHTAGDRARAESLLLPEGGDAATRGWSDPSPMDLRGPFKAPYQLEWVDLTRNDNRRTRHDPDMRVQRILAPANRFVDALLMDAGYWWNDYRLSLADSDVRTPAGNMLAVVAWMFQELDLASECARLIEPRSIFLQNDRWLRVQTDAWLPLLAGDPARAVDTIYGDAESILRQPEPDPYRPYRNADVAATAALFLYQQANDRRSETLRDVVGILGHPALPTYLRHMYAAVHGENHSRIRDDLARMLPILVTDGFAELLTGVAVLEYVQTQPGAETMRDLIRGADALDAPQLGSLAAALSALRDGRLDDAEVAVRALGDAPGARQLAATIRFRREQVQAPEALRAALMAVPLGERAWAVVTADRRLVRFEPPSEVRELAAPGARSTGWFPGPANWPWLDWDAASGRTWAYDRRRVFELDGGPDALSLNLRPSEIAAFSSLVGPMFDGFARELHGTLAARKAEAPAEDGEFLRRELLAFQEFVADPDLPEIALIRPLDHDQRVVHVAVRGGPQWLLHRTGGSTKGMISSAAIAREFSLQSPLRFHPQALRPGSDTAAAPVVYLMSTVGLMRVDFGETVRVRRIRMPGDFPFPELIPESTPYDRRDPRFVYVARTPRDGGGVLRVQTADDGVAELDMVNLALPPDYYRLMRRSELRALVDDRFSVARLQDADTFITDAAATVRAWKSGE